MGVRRGPGGGGFALKQRGLGMQAPLLSSSDRPRSLAVAIPTCVRLIVGGVGLCAYWQLSGFGNV